MKGCWKDIVFPGFVPVPSSSQSKKQTQRVPLGEDLVSSSTCEVGVANSIPGGPQERTYACVVLTVPL